MIFLLASRTLTSSFSRLIALIPSSSNVCSSSACEIPSLLSSVHILSSLKRSSSASMILSILESKSVNASKPSAATSPLDKRVWSPNNSLPSSIVPFSLTSRTSMASPIGIHAVCSLKPSPSKSKYTPSSTLVENTPSLFKSKMRGSLGMKAF